MAHVVFRAENKPYNKFAHSVIPNFDAEISERSDFSIISKYFVSLCL